MKSLMELQREALGEELEITPDVVLSMTREELMTELAQYYAARDDRDLLMQIDVNHLYKISKLNDNDYSRIITNANQIYIAEEKLDDVHIKWHLGQSHNRIDSKHHIAKTYEYREMTDHLPHMRDLPHALAGTVIDGGVIMPVSHIVYGKTATTSFLNATTATLNSKPARAVAIQEIYGWCLFHPYDLLFLQGTDVRNLPYSERKKLLDNVIRQLSEQQTATNQFLRQPRATHEDFKGFYETITNAGGEGIVIKNLTWCYESGKVSRGMYKMKKTYPLDVFVTGYVPGQGEFDGLIGSLRISVFMSDGRKVEIGAVAPGDMATRIKMSVPGSGELRQEFLGQVLTVKYQCRTKNGLLRDPQLVEYRYDKRPDECIFFEENED